MLLRVLHATEAQFHTGWFVESLATQTLVLFVIRTMGNPLDQPPEPGAGDHDGLDRGDRPRAAGDAASARSSDSRSRRRPIFCFSILATVTYLALVEVVKRIVVRRLGIQTSRDV